MNPSTDAKPSAALSAEPCSIINWFLFLSNILLNCFSGIPDFTILSTNVSIPSAPENPDLLSAWYDPSALSISPTMNAIALPTPSIIVPATFPIVPNAFVAFPIAPVTDPMELPNADILALPDANPLNAVVTELAVFESPLKLP